MIACSLLMIACSGTLGCSNSEDAATEQYSTAGSSDGPNEGGGSESGTDTGSETTGESDAGTEPAPGPDDPDLDAGFCDPEAEQVITYGLVMANAQAEPVLVRESVLAGDGKVPPIPLSARPFLNHFDFGIPPAEQWDPQISGELWQPPMLNAELPRYRLQYAIRGPQMLPDERLPVDLAIVVDLGAVMVGEPLQLAEEALAAIESALRPGDRVTLIAAGPVPILLGTTLIDNDAALLTGLLDQQEPSELADVAAALALAYETIAPDWQGQGQTRVLLISNGHFATDGLAAEVEQQAAAGHYLVTLGVGDPSQLDLMKLASLANEGRGPMLFARDGDEIWMELEQSFTEHMLAAATELEVTLTLPRSLAVRQRDNLAPAPKDDVKLALLGPNGALVFHHELEACGELDADAVIRVDITWVDPLIDELKGASWEQPVSAPGDGSVYGHKGAATVAYVRALRAFRDADPAASYGAVLDAVSLISDALVALPEDHDLLEMSAVMAKLSDG